MTNSWRIFALASAAALAACPAMGQERLMREPASLQKLVKSPPPALPQEPKGAHLADAYQALVNGQYAKARTLAEPLAEKGDPGALHLIGYIYERGLGVKADIVAALRNYGDAALKGNADAQIALGLIAFEGSGVYPDYERAAGWFRLAAAQGDPRADVRLGVMYAEGVGVQQNLVAAAHHFAKAAARGDADGEFYLGLARVNGDGVDQDYAKGADSFARAAAKGHGEAAYHLALMRESTVLGPSDPGEAALLMKQAAQAGFVPAYAAMGLIVHRGDAPKDSGGVAADWFEMGARAGDPEAAFLYAVALSEGDGRDRNPAAAIALIDKLLSSKETPAALKAQANALRQTIVRRTNGPITLRN
jgi:hypothetical protein